ncbi:unnamed protein product, partial [Discosporangium mesarthrocarpum]
RDSCCPAVVLRDLDFLGDWTLHCVFELPTVVRRVGGGMAAQSNGLTRITSTELEFVAEDQLIEIVPKFKHGILHLIQGDFGPFVPQTRVRVPLWLATTLKKRQRCKIACPGWMSVNSLEKVLRAERDEDRRFTPLPHHYLEISSLLLHSASDDIDEPDRVRTLLEDVENVRRAKMYEGMGAAAQDVNQAVQVNNLGAMELLPVRNFFAEALASLYVVSGYKASDRQARELAEGLSGAGRGAGDGEDVDGGGGGLD